MGRKSRGKRRPRERTAEPTPSTVPPAPATAPGATSRRQALLHVFLVLVVGLLVFANSIANGYVYDDITIIVENPRLDDPWALSTFFGTSYYYPLATRSVYVTLDVTF